MKLNSDGQNSISHYLCYTGKNLTCHVMSARILWASDGRAPTAGVAVKLNSGGRNSISHYLCYTGKNLTCHVMSAKILWGDRWSRLRRAVAVKRDSVGRNPFSHYPCYGKLTSSVPKPSPQFTVTFGSSSTVIFDQVGKASLRIKILCQYNKGKAKLHSDHRNATSRQRSPQGRATNGRPYFFFLLRTICPAQRATKRDL